MSVPHQRNTTVLEVASFGVETPWDSSACCRLGRPTACQAPTLHWWDMGHLNAFNQSKHNPPCISWRQSRKLLPFAVCCRYSWWGWKKQGAQPERSKGKRWNSSNNTRSKKFVWNHTENCANQVSLFYIQIWSLLSRNEYKQRFPPRYTIITFVRITQAKTAQSHPEPQGSTEFTALNHISQHSYLDSAF